MTSRTTHRGWQRRFLCPHRAQLPELRVLRPSSCLNLPQHRRSSAHCLHNQIRAETKFRQRHCLGGVLLETKVRTGASLPLATSAPAPSASLLLLAAAVSGCCSTPASADWCSRPHLSLVALAKTECWEADAGALPMWVQAQHVLYREAVVGLRRVEKKHLPGEAWMAWTVEPVVPAVTVAPESWSGDSAAPGLGVR